MEDTLKKVHSEDHAPDEVVLVYRQSGPQEVVEVYSRPLPGCFVQSSGKKAKKARKKKTRTGLWVFLGCFAAIVVLAGVFLAIQAYYVRQYLAPFQNRFEQWVVPEQTNREITIPTWPIGQGVTLELEEGRTNVLPAQEVYQKVNPAVVSIMVRCGETMSLGTGVIFTQDGYVLTNYHLVQGGEECAVILESGYSHPACYVAGDENSDLAVLKIDVSDLPAVEFGDSGLLVVGDPVYAIGNPLGYELWGTLTDGIVSAVDREVNVGTRAMTLIQTNAALNTGNSGGPLINEYGQVVGLNVIKMTAVDASVEGLGFAIPTVTIRRVVNDLLTYGQVKPEPLLGLSVMQTATQLGEDLWGLEVAEVVDGGAADLAGVRAGDYVLAVDGETLMTSAQLLRLRKNYYVGDEMTVTLWREGTVTDVVLSLTQAAE